MINFMSQAVCIKMTKSESAAEEDRFSVWKGSHSPPEVAPASGASLELAYFSKFHGLAYNGRGQKFRVVTVVADAASTIIRAQLWSLFSNMCMS